ncbi:MAG: hypothetical protein M0P63_00220 [Azoarcus sp.]|nr:hypothetical protein [Azoarcus sp.]
MTDQATLIANRSTAGSAYIAAAQALRDAYIELAALDKASTSGAFFPGYVPLNEAGAPYNVGPASYTNLHSNIPFSQNTRTFSAPLEIPEHPDFPLPSWPNFGDKIKSRLEQLIA